MTPDITRDVVAVKVETAARMLDMSQYTLLYLIRAGKVPATKVGRTWRVPIAAIEAIAGGRDDAGRN